MAEKCHKIDYDFRPLPPLDYHVNSVIALTGFIYVFFLNIHALFSYCRMRIQTARHGGQRMNDKSVCALFCVLLSSWTLFGIYSLEFWIFSACEALNIDINPFKFCNIFQHFLYSSIILYMLILYFYFSVRLKMSFNTSTLAFPTDCFTVIRILATIATLFGVSVAFIFSCGVPWNVDQRRITDDHPGLCRNVVIWEGYWQFIYLCGFAMLLCANLMNWVGYMNRLTKLIAMKLRYKLSFKIIVEESITDSNFNEDNEDMDDDVLYEHKLCESSEMQPPVELPDLPQFKAPDKRSSEVLSRSQTGQGQRPSKSEMKARRIARRKPDELRFYQLIRKQSILTGVVSVSLFLFWTLQSIFDKGSIFILIDILINVTCVYLSVSWSKNCYRKLCYRFSRCCCWCCEDCIETKVAKELAIMAKQQRKERELRVGAVV
eukprot:208321_1